MKTSLKYLSLTALALLVVAPSGFAIQTDNSGRGKATPTTTPSTSSGGRNKGKPTTAGPNVNKTAKTPSGRGVKLAELTVNAGQPGCQVSLDGGAARMTDQSGLVKLPSLKPGPHTLIVRKANYHEVKRTVVLNPGLSSMEYVVLVAVEGTLNVTTNVTGIEIEIGNVGKYSESIAAMPLSPGRYLVTASKLGYRTATYGVEIKSSQVSNLAVTVDPLTVDELLAQAKEEYEKKNYERAIALARAVLEKQINQAKAHALIGSSFYAQGNYGESISYLTKAVTLGEDISFVVKHRHGGSWDGKSLCVGRLTLRSNALEFYSLQFPDESFKLSYAKVYEMAIKDEMRLATKIGFMKADGKETKKEYNFYSPDADATGRIVTCASCLSQMQVVLQIIRQFRPRP
jgi:hypothetical protein